MLTKNDLLHLLSLPEGPELDGLWAEADAARRSAVGDAVHLRGLIEISNHCIRQCHYCGLRVQNHDLTRYRMERSEVVDCARAAVRFGYGTVVLQGGEDAGISTDWVSDVVGAIKRETSLAVTLSLGERREEELAEWRRCGADRYLLRFETSNPALFARIHPPSSRHGSCDRIGLLRLLRQLGYEVGSGVMVGIPGQTYADLADDLLMFRALDLDMIGVGPFIAHPQTPLSAESDGASAVTRGAVADAQAPASELMTYKMMALARLMCPRSNIPSTSALATINLANGREKGLQRGANVMMPNLTPAAYRAHYEIYPAKACIRETAEQCHGCMRMRITSIGRQPGTGPGASPNMLERTRVSGRLPTQRSA